MPSSQEPGTEADPGTETNAERRRVAWLLGGLIGLLAAAVGVAVGELGAAISAEFVSGTPIAPAVAVGEWAIDLSPAWLKEQAIRTFGTHDKSALLTGIYITIAVVSALVGVLARRHLRIATGLAAAFGVVGLIAAFTRPVVGFGTWFPALLAGGATVAVLWWLTIWSQQAQVRKPAGDPAQRRHFLVTLGGTGAGALVGGFGSRAWLNSRYTVAPARANVVLPEPAVRLPEVPASAHPDVPDLEPFFTPNAQFYRVDTAMTVPQVDPREWMLRIHGMVDRPVSISFEDLLRMPLEEHDLTLTCVSNTIGGPYCGNARWLGAPLAPLLRRAGVRAGADQIMCTSFDGMTIGTPVEAVLDGRQAMLAVAMNGQTLPVEHGFPCRMLVPGLYGYVSATKWVVDLKLTTFAAESGFWVSEGWSQQAPVKTASRIDVPGTGASLTAGTIVVAGVAWATHRGVAGVEVQVDKGPWVTANLATADTPDTWRQWSYPWQATKGSHTLTVRCTDGTGTLETPVIQDTLPDGATGYHSIQVTVG
ncbi:oxidoreductase molybdopterin binding [Catenulispora acidiphila DSM 44928]|uniref:Oxidoreductase molybdopterin binding n=1 Tax=Catenulispora acidiphila (strain DSM 44928 / JCM 14897 / NBRC 102108 / NRRL B-24433 / ID139908) TaxID=479433 RepID=C7QAD4_CATAD|nr:molybdopterin-dependent oxidoreductase [Catenulispora acidiphila]ACU72433.1 oxidoreductase molybdopterin binding [Catenulispora acidiphila DSM 44928]